MKTKEIIIGEPIWSIKGFGLSRQNMGSEGTFVTCSFKDKHDNLVFPGRYYVATKDILKRKVINRRGVDLYCIPFSESRCDDPGPKQVMVNVKCKVAPFVPTEDWCLECQTRAPDSCRGCQRFIQK